MTDHSESGGRSPYRVPTREILSGEDYPISTRYISDSSFIQFVFHLCASRYPFEYSTCPYSMAECAILRAHRDRALMLPNPARRFILQRRSAQPLPKTSVDQECLLYTWCKKSRLTLHPYQQRQYLSAKFNFFHYPATVSDIA